MKKLMFSAAIAAMSAGAFAGVAQVYDMTITLKTTECKDNKKLITDKCGNSYRYYRAQTSYKFEGKFWGCGCGTIANPIADQYGMPRLSEVALEDITCDVNNNSYMFWGKNAAFHHVDFTWDFLQLIGKNSTNVEGYFSSDFYLCDKGDVADEPSLTLVGAGYGKAYIKECMLDDDGDGEFDGVYNRIESMNGSVVGIYDVVDLAGMVGCNYCGGSTDCAPFPFCPACDGKYSPELSAAFGTFTLKHNSGLANKINKGGWIDEAYKFKSFVKDEFECIAAGEPVDPVSEKKAAFEKADKAWKEADAAWEVAKAARKDLNATRVEETAAWKAADELLKAASDATILYLTNDCGAAIADIKAGSIDNILNAAAEKAGVKAEDWGMLKTTTSSVYLEKDYPIAGGKKGDPVDDKTYYDCVTNKITTYEALYTAKAAAKGEQTSAVKAAQEDYDKACDVLVLVRREVNVNASAELKAALDKFEGMLNKVQELWTAENDALAARDAIVFKPATQAEKDAADAVVKAAEQKANDLAVIRAEALRQCGAECL